MTKYAWPWDQDTKSWSLEADPRYQVKDFTIAKINAGEPGYDMLIDGHVVDSADASALAMMRLEACYEYEEHCSDLELARLRLRQATERLAERYPRVARDPQLASSLEGLGDALGNGPEANHPHYAEAQQADIYRQAVSPDLAFIVDSSHCIVAEVSDGQGRVVRRVTVSDVNAWRTAVGNAGVAQLMAIEEAEEARACPGLEGKRCAEGRLTQTEAVEWLIRKEMPRWRAIGLTQRVRKFKHEEEGMTYDGTYWRVPADTPESGD